MQLKPILALIALALAASTQLSPASASPPGGIEFEVLRNGEPFGRHVVSVSETEGRVRVESQVALRVGLGPVALYRYEHSCSETWRQGALNGLRCATLRDGRRTRVNARLEGGRLLVVGARGVTAFPLDALPTSWWRMPPASLTSMIDTETGARMPLRVTDMGREEIQVGANQINARRVRVQGRLTVDLWYDEQGRWVACAFAAQGQRIVYRLASGPA